QPGQFRIADLRLDLLQVPFDRGADEAALRLRRALAGERAVAGRRDGEAGQGAGEQAGGGRAQEVATGGGEAGTRAQPAGGWRIGVWHGTGSNGDQCKKTAFPGPGPRL